MTPFEAYKMYLALKMHFTNANYDYFKYNGKVKANQDSFEKRNDKYQFAKLAKKNDLQDFFVSNFLEDTNWIGEFNSAKGEEVHADRLKRLQALTYNFQQELKQLEDGFINFFMVTDGQAPPILSLYRRKKISIETIIILNDQLHFFPYWDKMIIDPIIYPKFRDKCVKYAPFIQYDRAKFKKIIKNYLTAENHA